MTNEDDRELEERELARRFSELRQVDESRAPAFADLWQRAAHGRKTSGLRLALLGAGAAAVAGAAVAVMLSLSPSPVLPSPRIDRSGREPLGFLLAPPLEITSTTLEADSDPYSLHLDELLRTIDTGAAK